MSEVVFIFGLVAHMDFCGLVTQDVLTVQEFLRTSRVIIESAFNMVATITF